MEPMDIVACHRPEETGRVIVKELNTKDAQNVLEEKHKLTSINLNDDNTYTNNKWKIFINQSLCIANYSRLYGMVEDLNNEGLIDSFWITNGTIKIKESTQSKPISTHESDLHFWKIKKLGIDMINRDFAFNAMRLSDSRVNENMYGVLLSKAYLSSILPIMVY